MTEPQPLCGTCIFWGKPGQDGKFRQCTAVIHDGDEYNEREVAADDNEERARKIQRIHNRKAVVCDKSGYFAALRTQEDFGCVLHKPKVSKEGEISA